MQDNFGIEHPITEPTLQTLLRSWFGLHVVTLAAFIIQRSTHPTVFGRYSTKVAFAIVLLALSTPLVIWEVRTLPQLSTKTEHRFGRRTWWGLLFLSAILLCGVWLAPIGPTTSHQLLRFYFSVMWGTVALWALAHLSPWPVEITHALPSSLVVGTCLVLLWVATFFPGLKWTDEGLMANAAWAYFHTGTPVSTMYQPTYQYVMSFWVLGLGVWLNFFGMSLSAARLYIFVLGLLSLLVTFLAARKVYSTLAAWGAVIAGAFGLSTINYVNTDIEVTLLLSLALYVYVTTTGHPTWRHGVVGFLVSFSVDGHPIAYRIGIAFGMAYLWEWFQLLRTKRRWVWHTPTLWLVLGAGLGLGTYVSWYAAHNAMFRTYANSPFTFNGLESLSVFASELREAVHATPLLLLLSVLGAFAAWKRNTAFDRLLVFTLIVPPIVLALLYPRMRQYYLMHTLTLQALLVAALFQYIADAIPTARRRATVLSGLLVLLVVANGAFLYQRIQHKDAQSYDEALEIAAEAREFLSPKATIVAPDPFYFGLWEYDFREAATPEKLAFQDGISLQTAWERIAPDAVLIVHGYPIPELSQGAAEYVQTHAYRLVRTWETQRLGAVELYLRQPD